MFSSKVVTIMMKRVIEKLLYYISLLSNSRYIKYLRRKGIQVGDGCVFRNRHTIRVDVTRPSLVTIGNNVDFNMNFQLLTHDYANSIAERYSREPRYEEFYEEFALFVDRDNIHKYPKLPIASQLGVAYEDWLSRHKAPFADFEAFISEAKQHKN